MSEQIDKHQVEHVAERDNVDTYAAARHGFAAETALNVKTAFRLYPYGCLWSIMLSAAIIMEGYDLALLRGFLAYPEWNRQFGTLQPDGSYVVRASWQTALVDVSLVGNIIGLVLTGFLTDRFGCRRSMMAALALLTGTLFILIFARTLEVLVVGQLLVGLPLGVRQTLTTQYAAEVCPTPLRHILTAWVNLSWVIGQFISAGALRGCLSRTDEWEYRIPYALQWIWPVPLIIGTWFAPESPWWLVRHGRIDEAKKSLLRLTSARATADFDADETVALMQHTIRLENEVTAGSTYAECFRGVNRRRTEISCMAQFSQNLVSPLIYQSTYFLLNAGLATEKSFDMTMVQSAIGFVGTLISMWSMRRFGRRPLYVVGFAVITTMYFVIGFLGLIPEKTDAQCAVRSLLIVANFVYQSTVGPTAYAIIAEISSNRLRSKVLVCSRIATNCLAILNGYYVPQFINPTALNWGAKAGWYFAGTGALAGLYMFFRLPEPKGLTYGEVDILFNERVPARKLAKTKVDQFAVSEAKTRSEGTA